eukprot:TRINITY_DN63989_c0_g1_i1.p1 TRINITY_DN63989_c0_g1~~TRINITY_DN63989_c0_g1_i1.p1  ORF type:complete len:603 (+),score=80.16 TRINITY_DN63989_c0_g1_i1:272-1810(+)
MADEVEVWQEVCKPGHDNILRLYHFNARNSEIAMELIDPIGFDLVSLGTQYSYDNGKSMPIAETADIFTKLISALRYLNVEKEILHRDIKADQVLITSTQSVKLTDFGLAISLAKLSNDRKARCMPRNQGATNIAPEIPWPGSRDPAMYDAMVDVFGLGWILSQLYCNLITRKNGQLSENVLNIECGDDIGARTELQELMKTKEQLTKTNPAERMTLDQLEACAWIKTAREFEPQSILSQSRPVEVANRSFVRRFRKRLVSLCANLQDPFPAEGMLLEDIDSPDWTCLLIEKPSGHYDTFPSATTRIRRGERIFFQHKDAAQVEVICTNDEELQTLVGKLDSDGQILEETTVGGVTLRRGCELRNSTEEKLGVGVALCFDYDPSLQLSRMLKMDLSESKTRAETVQHLIPFSLEFDAFQFPGRLVTPSAVLGPGVFKATAHQRALDFRASYRINLAGIARLVEGSWEVNWMPGPDAVVLPGDFGLVVRRPSNAGITLPTITDSDLVNKGLVE